MRAPRRAKIIYEDGRERWFNEKGQCYCEVSPTDPAIQAELNRILAPLEPQPTVWQQFVQWLWYF